MKKLLFLSLFTALFLGFMAPANAAIVNVPVTDDGYRFEHPGGHGWGWGYDFAKSYNTHGPTFNAYGPMKFDIAGTLGSYISVDIISAEFKLYVTEKQGAGPAAYPEGTEGIFNIKVYSIHEPQWHEGADDEDMPKYYMPLEITQSHNNGYDVWASFDFTQIVKIWLDFGAEYANGIEVWDGIPADELGFYWNSREASEFQPYLEVNAVPIPGAVYLLGSGLIGLIGFGRKKIRA